MMAHAVYANRWNHLAADEREAARFDMIVALEQAIVGLRVEIGDLEVSRGMTDKREFVSRSALMALLDAPSRGRKGGPESD